MHNISCLMNALLPTAPWLVIKFTEQWVLLYPFKYIMFVVPWFVPPPSVNRVHRMHIIYVCLFLTIYLENSPSVFLCFCLPSSCTSVPTLIQLNLQFLLPQFFMLSYSEQFHFKSLLWIHLDLVISAIYTLHNANIKYYPEITRYHRMMLLHKQSCIHSLWRNKRINIDLLPQNQSPLPLPKLPIQWH
jgi:hypothetical protein